MPSINSGSHSVAESYENMSSAGRVSGMCNNTGCILVRHSYPFFVGLLRARENAQVPVNRKLYSGVIIATGPNLTSEAEGEWDYESSNAVTDNSDGRFNCG